MVSHCEMARSKWTLRPANRYRTLSMITAAGLPVIDGELVLPRVGAWHADLVAQGSTALVVGSACEIAIDNVGSFQASVVRSGAWLDTVWARVSAGAGGATKTARALHYRNTTRRGVVQDLLRAGGEALASTSDAAILGANLVSYTQLAQPVGQSLSALLDGRKVSTVVYAFDGGKVRARVLFED